MVLAMRRIVARILPAAVGALAFVLVLAAFSVADDGPFAPQPAPPTLTMPVAKAGDRALYSQEIVGHNDRTPPSHYTTIEHGPAPWMAFEMLDVALRDADDGPHREYAARVTQYDMAKHDGTPLRASTVVLDGGRVADPLPAPERHPEHPFDGTLSANWDCMLWSLANGRTVDLAERVVLYDDCDVWTGGADAAGGVGLSGSGGLDRGEAFRALGLDTVGGVPAVVLRYDWAGSYALVWMSEQVPYPLIVVMGEKPPPAGEGPQMITYRLERYEAGDGVPRAAELAAAKQLMQRLPAGVALAPRQPWGLDEDGVQDLGPFPASAAWTAALGDDGEVGAWLRSHPEAAATTTYAFHDVVPGPALRTERYIWDFVADDGADALYFRVTRESRALEGVAVVPPVPETTFEALEARAPLGLPLPEQVPSLASMEPLWHERLAPDADHATLDHWELRIGGGPETARWDVAVGHDRLVHATPGQPERQETSVLRLEDSGAVLAEGGTDPSGPEAGAPPFDTTGADLQGATIDEASWRAPVAVAAAGGAGLLAAAVTAWLAWKPSVLGVALFSRIQEQRLLDHPVRRRILDVVAGQPGIHGAELVRRVGAARGSVAHHVAKLVDAGQLVATQAGKYACYRLPAAKTAGPPGSMHVLEALRGVPGASASQLARVLQLSPATVHYHLQKLRAAGLLDPHAGPGLWPTGVRAAA
ncbi:MAG: Helix-turn-helix domain [Thermoplasmata archaeon]|jgi:DNA-binding MarR family transcriptional regulator|nr:Helix-turn-helix domain [Thermoplasmata archaeon]